MLKRIAEFFYSFVYTRYLQTVSCGLNASYTIALREPCPASWSHGLTVRLTTAPIGEHQMWPPDLPTLVLFSVTLICPVETVYMSPLAHVLEVIARRAITAAFVDPTWIAKN